MAYVEFENLDLIPKMLEILNDLKETINLITPNLNSGIDVQRFLGISRGTLSNLIKSGQLREGEHYKLINNKKVFIPEKIIEFKKTYIKHAKINTKAILADNIVNKMLKEVA